MSPEAIYQAWAKAFAERDLEGVLALYTPDAMLESPLVNNLLHTERGIVEGRENLRNFFAIILQSTPPLKNRYRANFFTNGTVMMWEYPRVTPTGEQTDMTEVMELKDGQIHRHRIYWGWGGSKLLQKDQYRIHDEQSRTPNKEHGLTDTQTIRELEDRRFRALCEADTATLEKLLADGLVYTHSSAAVDSKASILAGIKAKKWEYKKVERPVEDIQVHADCAIVTGEVRIDVIAGGNRRSLHSRYVDVWVRGPKGWQMTAWQSTPIPPKT